MPIGVLSSYYFFISYQIKKYLQSTRAPFFAILVPTIE